MQKKWLLGAGIAVCLVAAAWAYYSYQKPRADVTSANAAYNLPAANLYQAFSTNEASANEQFIGKVITVTGTVADVQQSGNATLVLLAEGETGGVSCSLREPLPHTIDKGSTLTIKGRCTGYLMDVNLVDAVVLK